MSIQSSRLPFVPLLSLLRAKSSSANATLVTTAAELASLGAGATKQVWVFGDKELVDAAIGNESFPDVHVLELVRKDTGFLECTRTHCERAASLFQSGVSGQAP